VSAVGWNTCMVVNASGVVLGRLGRKALGSEEEVAVEAVMTAGPSTVRPSITLAAIVERMQSQKLDERAGDALRHASRSRAPHRRRGCPECGVLRSIAVVSR